MKLFKIKFASKCSALSKASKPCEDRKKGSKEADKIIANEHPNDIIDVTQYDIDSNFPKRLVFGKVHYGSLSNRKIKSKEKQIRMPGLISKKVSMMYQKESREIEHTFYMPFWFIWLMEGKIKHKKC